MDLTVDDRLAIQDLLAKYLVYMDRQEEEWVALFDESASFEVAGREPLSDPTERKQFFHEAPRGVHLASAPVIRPGAREGSALSTQTFLFRNAETEAFRTGWYDDELVRRDGTWRFKVRRVGFFDV
jgi:3-phenylpropionate/cinnamic acid dioxygenase small subunit